MATVVLSVSVFLQFLAAALAFRLTRTTGRTLAWVLIAVAMGFMGVRRALTLYHVVTTDANRDLDAELVALFISILLVTGVALIGPLFDKIKKAQDMERAARDELERRVRERTQDLRIAKNEAERANLAKSEFLSHMSHELRTPLNAVIGFSEIMERETFGPLGDKRYPEYAHHIRESGAHLLALINDILDVAAVEADRLSLEESEIHLADIAETCIRLVRNQADKVGVTVINDVTYSLPQIIADERRLKQIVLNMLSNAVKFTPNGGTVSLNAETGSDDNSLRLAVSDTGIGMTDDEIATALEPFGRIKSDYSDRQPGTGLGLPLTKSLAEAHGALFEMISAKGKGTTVSIVFPAERVIA